MNTIPPSLTAGDTIAIVAPAGNIQAPKRYHSGCSILKEMGFTVIHDEKKWPGDGFLSDHDEMRAEELMAAWRHPDVKAIFALRGGYGSLRILKYLDVDVIRKNPKFFIGFSDITILLNHIAFRAHQVCLHGPVVSSLAVSDKSSIDRLYHCLLGNWHTQLSESVEIVRAAPSVSGTLTGGNLSSLATLLGTHLDNSYDGTILFIEDVNEPLYRLDRLLTQFHLSGKFNGVKGIILGDFSNDQEADRHEQNRVHEFVWKRVLELVPDCDIPIWGNFPAGHTHKNITLPIGALCTMDSSQPALSFLGNVI